MDRILMIDDDKALCALIQRSVLREGMEADVCHSGSDGLGRLETGDYQLVILDVMMPGMDGFEILERIRAESKLPILMFTSKDDSASKVRGLRAGEARYWHFLWATAACFSNRDYFEAFILSRRL